VLRKVTLEVRDLDRLHSHIMTRTGDSVARSGAGLVSLYDLAIIAMWLPRSFPT
jgi:hypothetical protein